jgi:Flp pilus assembly protein TadG
MRRFLRDRNAKARASALKRARANALKGARASARNGQRPNARNGQRGAVAVEFALSLFLLIPLLFGMLNYGYYFWVGLNATEGAQMAARSGLMNGSTPLSACPTAFTTPSLATQQGLALSAAQNYVANKTGLPTSYVTLVSSVSGNNACSASPFGWKMAIQVDFPPIAPFTLPFMPASSISGRTKFTTTTFLLPP